MGVKFGEVDSNQILENEFRIGVLESILDRIFQTNPTINGPSQSEVNKIRQQVADQLKKKYPNSGIEFKKD
ncbi:hypothetical protein [Fodinibius saliphilus]|uniref:hypothetical protein n=1 Tax=Fodinibius saliphilus TaxID=1920650 RepID=UPI001108BE13|nr:hypothetical protein [Fodinibius saliphilus]